MRQGEEGRKPANAERDGQHRCFKRFIAARDRDESSLNQPERNPKPRYRSDIYTPWRFFYYPVVVWQFWGRAAEASWTGSRALFSLRLRRIGRPSPGPDRK